MRIKKPIKECDNIETVSVTECEGDMVTADDCQNCCTLADVSCVVMSAIEKLSKIAANSADEAEKCKAKSLIADLGVIALDLNS